MTEPFAGIVAEGVGVQFGLPGPYIENDSS